MGEVKYLAQKNYSMQDGENMRSVNFKAKIPFLDENREMWANEISFMSGS